MMESNYTGGNIICEATEQATNCYEEGNTALSKEVAYKGTKITGGTIKFNSKLELMVMTDLQVGSSDTRYVYTTIGGASEVTPEECFSITSEGVLSAASDYFDNNKCPRDLVVPSEVNGIKVVKIEDNAFDALSEEKKLTSVVISNGVQEIGAGAFYYHLIKYVILPDSLNILGGYTFRENKIEYVNLPENIELGGDDFGENNIETLILPKGIVFSGSSDFDLAGIKNLIISDGVTEIGEWEFGNNQITKLVIPGSVKRIWWSGLSNNQIAELTLSEGVAELYEYAFSENNLTSVTIPSTVTMIGKGVFADNNNLTTIVNKTGRAFDWLCVLGGDCSGATQVTGSYTIDGRTINVITE